MFWGDKNFIFAAINLYNNVFTVIPVNLAEINRKGVIEICTSIFKLEKRANFYLLLHVKGKMHKFCKLFGYTSLEQKGGVI